MAGINKVILVGRLGQDPEMRYFQDGTALATFSIATSDNWQDKETGERKEKTEWHRIVAFKRLAEICGQYLSKGRQVYVEGKLQTREWEDRDGNKRWTTEIVANTMQMLGPRPDGAGGGPTQRGDYGGGYPDRQGGGYQERQSGPTGGGYPSPQKPRPQEPPRPTPAPGPSYDGDGGYDAPMSPGGGFSGNDGPEDDDIPF